MSKRPTITEIIELKRRAGLQEQAVWRITHVSDLLVAQNLSVSSPTGRFMIESAVVSAVTLLENAVKKAIKELADADPERFVAISPLSKDIKIDAALIISMGSNVITLGDFASHSTTIGSIGGLFSKLEALGIENIEHMLSNVHERWIEEKESWPLPPILERYDLDRENVRRLFDARHIIVHEIAGDSPCTELDVPTCLASAVRFCEAIDWLRIELQFFEVPKTQTEINRTAIDALSAARTALAIRLRALRAEGGRDKVSLNTSQLAWMRFARAEAISSASAVEGGSMWSMVYCSRFEVLARQRLRDLHYSQA